MSRFRGESQLRNGTATLTLNPSCLEYLNEKFRSLLAHENPTDSMRGGMYNVRDVVQLYKFIQQVPTLKLVATVANSPHLDEGKYIDLSLFRSLSRLELHEIDPKYITNLWQLSAQLHTFAADESVTTLKELLEGALHQPQPRRRRPNAIEHADAASSQDIDDDDDDDEEEAFASDMLPWQRLTTFACRRSLDRLLVVVDDSARFLANVQHLDLSHNSIEDVEMLVFCSQLVTLNLSHNRLRSVGNFTAVFRAAIPTLQTLDLSKNRLTAEGLEGLAGLTSVQCLDLSHNRIPVTLNSLQPLADALVGLRSLRLEGNPFWQQFDDGVDVATKLKLYRVSLLALFAFARNPKGNRSFMLDGVLPSSKEMRKAAAVATSALNWLLPAPLPVSEGQAATQDNVSDTSSDRSGTIPGRTKKARKKRHRKAVITEEDADMVAGDDTADQLVRDTSQLEAAVAGWANGPQPDGQPTATATRLRSDSEAIADIKSRVEEVRRDWSSLWMLKWAEAEKQRRDAIREKEEAEQRAKEERLREELDRARREMRARLVLAMADVPDTEPEVAHADSTAEQTGQSAASGPLLTDTGGAARQSARPKHETINLNTEEDTTEEFFVHRTANDKVSVLVVSKSTITEKDASTASVMEQRLTRDLISAEDVTADIQRAIPAMFSDGLSRAVKLEFRSIGDRIDTIVYRVPHDEAERLVAAMAEIIKERPAEGYTVKCMQCDTVLHQSSMVRSGSGLTSGVCPRCGSTMLVEYVSTPRAAGITASPASPPKAADSTTPAEPTEPRAESAVGAPQGISQPAKSQPATATALTDRKAGELEAGLQLFFKLQIFRCGADEKFVYLYRTGLVRVAGGRAEDERTQCYVLVSTDAVYMLAPMLNRKPSEYGVGMVAWRRIADLRGVVVGLFMQMCRFEFSRNPGNEAEVWILLSRDHDRMHAFLDGIEETLRYSDKGLANRGADTASNVRSELAPLLGLSKEDFDDFGVIRYLLVFQKQQVSGSSFLFTKFSSGPQPRSLILTPTHVLLADEEHLLYPPSPFMPAVKAKPPQFRLVSYHPISDVLSIETHRSDPLAFTLVFDTEQDEEERTPTGSKAAASAPWELIAGATLEKEYFINTLSKVWFDIFKVNISHVERD